MACVYIGLNLLLLQSIICTLSNNCFCVKCKNRQNTKKFTGTKQVKMSDGFLEAQKNRPKAALLEWWLEPRPTPPHDAPNDRKRVQGGFVTILIGIVAFVRIVAADHPAASQSLIESLDDNAAVRLA